MWSHLSLPSHSRAHIFPFQGPYTATVHIILLHLYCELDHLALLLLLSPLLGRSCAHPLPQEFCTACALHIMHYLYCGLELLHAT